MFSSEPIHKQNTGISERTERAKRCRIVSKSPAGTVMYGSWVPIAHESWLQADIDELNEQEYGGSQHRLEYE